MSDAASVLGAVSCSTVRDCVAVGSAGDPVAAFYTTDGRANWTAGKLPDYVDELDTASCPTVRDCVAVSSAAQYHP